mgnify:CR=1 FL=1
MTLIDYSVLYKRYGLKDMQLTCSSCLNLFRIVKVYRESTEVDGNFCSKKCWDKWVKK